MPTVTRTGSGPSAGVGGDAFTTDPVMSFIFPSEPDRVRRVTALFTVLVKHFHASAGEITMAGGDNVGYYQRFGFRVVGDIALPGGPHVPTMWRPAAR